MGLRVVREKNKISTEREERVIKTLFSNGKLKRLLERSKAILAGGALTSIFSNEPINDLDIFFPSETAWKLATGKMRKYIFHTTERAISYKCDNHIIPNITYRHGAYGPVYSIDKAETSEILLQFVRPTFAGGTIQEIFSDFDFTVCMAAYSFDTEDFTFHPRFFVDLARKFLHFNAETTSPVTSLIRVYKYMDKKFTISQGELIKIVLAVLNQKEEIKTYGNFFDKFDTVVSPQLQEHIRNILAFPNDKFFNECENDEIMQKDFSCENTIDMIDDYETNGKYIPSNIKSLHNFKDCENELTERDII